MSCKRAQEFLATHEVKVGAETNAKKEKRGLDDAKKLLTDASRLIVAKGKKCVEIDLKKQPLSDDELAKLIIGPTGNLRAPTIKRGKTVMVGFHADMYEQQLG